MSRSGAMRIAGVAVLVAAALGLGYGMSRWWQPDAGTVATPPKTEETRLAAAPVKESHRDTAPAPILDDKSHTRRALLIGVTKYDNLPKNHLDGPGNDVRLMGRLLQEQFRFAPQSIVSLTEDEGTPERRPTRANIEREFRSLAEQAQEGDQVVILMAGHGARQPESDPPNPQHPEPDGIDEVFLPADVSAWKGFPERVPKAIVDDEIGVWLRAITAKKAYVWIVFDCCHSGTMTRGTEVVRELPPGLLVPEAELDKARARAAKRGTTRTGPAAKPAPFVPAQPSDYLVALYACRPQEETPESPQPVESADAKVQGLLTYTLVKILKASAASKTPLTYRDLLQRIQVQYAGRASGSPTPLIEGGGQGRVVLGTDQPQRPRLLLTRNQDDYKVNVGDLYGLTRGSILAVTSPAGTDKEPTLLGHVRVTKVRPFDCTVEPCAYEKSALVTEFPQLSTCRSVFIDYGVRQRFKIAIRVPKGATEVEGKLRAALQPLVQAKGSLIELVNDPAKADWLIQFEQGKVRLQEASGNRQPFSLPAPDDPMLATALLQNMEMVFRARNLIALGARFEEQRSHGSPEVDVKIDVLRHKGEADPGVVIPPSADGLVFRSGDLISFRVHNKSKSVSLNMTLLIVGSNFEINPFYPIADEAAGKSVPPGKYLTTPQGEITDKPPFGPETLMLIAVPAQKTPVDFTVLAQDGLTRARNADRNGNLRSPLGELLESAMFRSGTRSGVERAVLNRHSMRVLKWRTERK